MKHHIPQFELPGTEAAFNLCGEVIRQEAPAPAPPQDTDTPCLFPDDDGQPTDEDLTRKAGLTFDGEASFADDRS